MRNIEKKLSILNQRIFNLQKKYPVEGAAFMDAFSDFIESFKDVERMIKKEVKEGVLKFRNPKEREEKLKLLGEFLDDTIQLLDNIENFLNSAADDKQNDRTEISKEIDEFAEKYSKNLLLTIGKTACFAIVASIVALFFLCISLLILAGIILFIVCTLAAIFTGGPIPTIAGPMDCGPCLDICNAIEFLYDLFFNYRDSLLINANTISYSSHHFFKQLNSSDERDDSAEYEYLDDKQSCFY